MPKEWTGNLVGLMHVHKISFQTLAEHLGLSKQYVSMVLNGKRNPPDAEARFRQAVDELCSQNHSNTAGVR